MLEIKKVSKSFGEKKALDDVSFNVENGEIFGVIGQNGAGKSTLFRSIMDFYKYDGEITIDNTPIKKIDLTKIGFLPEERSLSPKKTIKQQIKYIVKLNKKKKITDDVIKEWLNLFEVVGNLNDKISTLSKGNQQKVQLISSLIYEPEYVILDEPFSGLDPYNVELLTKIIKQINKKGTTFIFSSHNMENIEEMCDRLIMLKDGKRILYGSSEEIKSLYERNLIEVETDHDISYLSDDPDVISIERKGNYWKIMISNEEYGKVIFMNLTREIGYMPLFSQQPPSLNEIFSYEVSENE